MVLCGAVLLNVPSLVWYRTMQVEWGGVTNDPNRTVAGP